MDNSTLFLFACLKMVFFYPLIIFILHRLLFKKSKLIFIICSIIVVIFALFQLIKSYQAYSSTRTPSVNEAKRALATHQSIVKEDMLYHSPDGYTLLIPAGYSYTTFDSGGVSLLGVNKTTALMIKRLSSLDNLDKVMQDLKDYVKETYQSYTASSSVAFTINGIDALRSEIQYTDPAKGPMTSTVVFFKKNNGYMVDLVCNKDLFDSEKDEFERIINSFK